MGGFVSCVHPRAGLAMTCLHRSRAPFFTRWFFCCFISRSLTSWFCHLQSWGSPITDLKLFLSFFALAFILGFHFFGYIECRQKLHLLWDVLEVALPHQTPDALWPSDLMVVIWICHFNINGWPLCGRAVVIDASVPKLMIRCSSFKTTTASSLGSMLPPWRLPWFL